MPKLQKNNKPFGKKISSMKSKFFPKNDEFYHSNDREKTLIKKTTHLNEKLYVGTHLAL